MATGIKYKPIAKITNPVTKGGKSHLISLIIVPSKKCNIPPNIQAVNATDKPCVAQDLLKHQQKQSLFLAL